MKNKKILFHLGGVLLGVFLVLAGLFHVSNHSRNAFSAHNTDFLESTGLAYEKERGERRENLLTAYDYSYYEYDEERQEYTTAPMFRMQPALLDPDSTAVVVIDPWCDAPFDEINQDVAENIEEYVMPIVKHALNNEISVYVFTNDPDIISYDTKINENLEELVEADEISLFYYTQFDAPEDFGEYLMENNIKSLIYIGYATNMCILYRDVGILSMKMSDCGSDFDMYIIPEATLAMVSTDTEDNMQMRNDICIMLAQQGIAKIVPYKHFINHSFGK